MKFTSSVVSLSLVCAGSLVEAADMLNMQHLNRAPIHGNRSDLSARSTVGSSFSSGIKKGLSFNDASLTHHFTSSEVSWAYNWGQTYSGSLPANVMYIPMLWSDASASTSTWHTNAQAAINKGAEYILGFNEPDLNAQANMTPEQAASAWMTYMQPFAGKAKLVGPAITNGAAPMGEAWLDEFISLCTKCTIDVYAMHIYDAATNEAYYKQYISSFASKYKKPVWVTEFGATGSASQVNTFLGSMVSYLDGLEGVGAYAWFMDEAGNLVNSDGTLTSLGKTYAA